MTSSLSSASPLLTTVERAALLSVTSYDIAASSSPSTPPSGGHGHWRGRPGRRARAGRRRPRPAVVCPRAPGRARRGGRRRRAGAAGARPRPRRVGPRPRRTRQLTVGRGQGGGVDRRGGAHRAHPGRAHRGGRVLATRPGRRAGALRRALPRGRPDPARGRDDPGPRADRQPLPGVRRRRGVGRAGPRGGGRRGGAAGLSRARRVRRTAPTARR